MDLETVRYETDGAVATITLDRPDAANAQSTQLIEDLDAAFDAAEADADVRVVVLAANGKHFSAGHDLKEILAGEEHWAAMRATPEGKLLHEQVMYWDKLVRIRDFPKITIAAVQGVCSAAGLMLACMCDLIVAADDAKFVMSYARVGLTPDGGGSWFLARALPRQVATEVLIEGKPIGSQRLYDLGVVNRVVARDQLLATAQAMAAEVALVPPITAAAVKDTINHMLDGQGQRDSWRYHFMVHQFVSNTETALARTEARKAGGMDAVKAEQAGESTA
jgi:enoyl-CoA hydratase/carnithine racemase